MKTKKLDIRVANNAKIAEEDFPRCDMMQEIDWCLKATTHLLGCFFQSKQYPDPMERVKFD